MQKEVNSKNYLEHAEKLIEINRFREAIPFLTKGIIENPADDWALCSMSMCFSQIGDNEKSLEYAEKAILNDPQSEWAYRLKGILSLRKGQPKECLKYAQKAVELEPENELALGNLVCAYLHNSLVEEADNTANNLLKISPDSATTLYLKGITESHLDNLEKAVEYFHQSLTISPNYAEARNALALVVLKQSNKAGSEKDKFEKEGLNHLADSVKSDPNNEFVIKNVKKPFETSSLYFTLIYLFPLFLSGLVVTPIMTGFISVFILLIFANQILKIHRRKKTLSPEMKNLLKIRNYAYFVGELLGKFVNCGIDFYKKIWKQALIALAICLVYFFEPNLPFQNYSYFALKIIFLGNFYWIFQQYFNYTGPK